MGALVGGARPWPVGYKLVVRAGAVANWRAECVSQVTVCTVWAVHRSAVTSWDPGIDAHTAVCATQVGMALCQPAGGGD